MLEIDSLRHDDTCGFKIVFRFETQEDVISLAYIIRGLVGSIYRGDMSKELTPDAAFCDVISTFVPHPSLSGITRELTYDTEDICILISGVVDPNDLEAINRVHDDSYGFRPNHGHPVIR